ncbi:MAG: Smr/MutS family protein [Bacteroidales bacterium]|nr:Smr/MutS family protein [Bacteroidales bacterium]
MDNYPENIEEKLGIHQIRNLIREKTLSPLGERWLEDMRFVTDGEKIQRELQQAGEFISLLEEDLSFPVDHVIDMTPVLKKIRVEGTFFTIEELFDLRQSLNTIRAVGRFFERTEEGRFQALKKLAAEMTVFPFVIDNIDKVLTAKGTIRDTASPGLKKIRQALATRKKGLSGLLHRVMKKAQAAGWVEKDAGLSVRNGRMVIPVPATHKRRIPGLILDESATGKTVFVEPAEVVELNNEIRTLGFAENREIEKILLHLSDLLRPYAPEMIGSYHRLGVFDFIRAKALFSLETGALVPEMQAHPVIDWRQAVHPLLYRTLKKENRKVVPLDIKLDEQERILVISGPNAGGKSVCLQTVGLLQYMFQCGLPVPVATGSVFGIFQAVFLDFGDEQSIENDLSTYSSRLLNMKYFLKHANQGTLILMDELGTGTEPMLGGALAETLLQRLNQTGTFGVVTTHYANLKHLAAFEKGIINGAMLFDHQNMQPLYRLEPGKPGSSFAFEMARKIGLPEDLLKEATQKVGEEHVLFDKHLKDILRDKRYWENKRKKIRQTEKKLESLLEKYEADMAVLQKQRKEILEQAREEAEHLLSGVNRKIENTIRVIRETQAEKERTKEVRKELEALKKKVETMQPAPKDPMRQQLSAVRSRRKKLGGKQANDQVIPEEPEILVGDKVRMEGHEIAGEVLDISQGGYLVSFGNLITQVSGARLKKVSDEEYRQQNGRKKNVSDWQEDLRKRKLFFRPEIDVRGQRAEEALRTVMNFIDEAVMVGEPNLRIIHGKGNGILRQMIHEYLYTMTVVAHFQDEHVERGGTGVTLVTLDL